MKYDSFTNQPTGTQRHRRSIRLKGYDYAQAGAYSITLVTYRRACLFGHVIDSEMELDDIGRIAEEQWLHTAEVRPNIELDEFAIMPNHIHGIIVIVDDVESGAVVGASRWLAHDETRGVPDRASHRLALQPQPPLQDLVSSDHHRDPSAP